MACVLTGYRGVEWLEKGRLRQPSGSSTCRGRRAAGAYRGI